MYIHICMYVCMYVCMYEGSQRLTACRDCPRVGFVLFVRGRAGSAGVVLVLCCGVLLLCSGSPLCLQRHGLFSKRAENLRTDRALSVQNQQMEQDARLDGRDSFPMSAGNSHDMALVQVRGWTTTLGS